MMLNSLWLSGMIPVQFPAQVAGIGFPVKHYVLVQKKRAIHFLKVIPDDY
jgi:hypothetical protein